MVTTLNSKGLVEAIGMAAIVASLIFVGLQLKQSQEIAIAGQYQERTATALEFWNTASQDDWFVQGVGQRELDLHGEILTIFPNTTAEEIGRLYVLQMKSIVVLDNHFFQFQSGFMTDEAWFLQRNTLKTMVAAPNFYHFMQKHESRFRASFLELCYQLRDEA